jgi:RNA-binding protein YhbY
MEEILKQVIHGRVHIQIGKSGITKGALQQIELQFKKKIC